jgi:two-component system sensor histidine kinase KdpD
MSVRDEPAPARELPAPVSGLPVRRRVAGFVVAVVALPLLTAVLDDSRGSLTLGSVLLLYLLAVVVVAAVGGTWPAVIAAVASVLAANWFLTPPYHTLNVEHRDSVVQLLVFALVAVVVAVTVEIAARDRGRAERSRREAELLSAVSASPAEQLSLSAVLEQVRATFGMGSAELVRRVNGGGPSVLASVGHAAPDDEEVRVPASAELELVLHGPALFAEDRSVLERLAAAAARAYETQHLVRLTDRLTEADRVRSALLASVGHDLRTPLAGLKAAVSSLRQDDVAWSPQEQADLLATVEESTDRLTALIADVLDATRIQVGAVTARPEPVAVDEVVALALLDAPSGAVRMDIPDDLPLVRVDPGLLGRVVANLVDNAVKHSPSGRAVDMTARPGSGGVELAVVDHGTGVPPELWDAMFEPFQRLDDHAAGAGAGLGLAIVRGFTRAMDVTVTPSQTAGGGLTMTLRLPVAAER